LVARTVYSHCLAFYWPEVEYILIVGHSIGSHSEDGADITAKDYLELALKPVKGAHGAAVAKNQIRESIRDLFPERDCCALVSGFL
jgi:hypothetical protein